MEELEGLLENNIKSFLETYKQNIANNKENEIISKFDNEDIKNIAFNVIDNEEIFDLIVNEILDYINFKK